MLANDKREFCGGIVAGENALQYCAGYCMDLTNHFLVSTGNLSGSVFADSIVLVCSHDREGAFGLVINKPSPAKESELLSTLKSAPPGGGSAAAGGGDGRRAPSHGRGRWWRQA